MNPSQKSRIESPLFEKFRGRMPSHESIIDQGMIRAVESLASDAEDLRARFSATLSLAQSEAFRAYEIHQRASGDQVLANFVDSKTRHHMFSDLDDFFTEVKAARQAFTKIAFETIAQGLFRRCGVPFEEFSTTGGVRSFVVPSLEDFREFSNDCMVYAVTSSLIESWAESILRESENATVFLALPQSEIGVDQLEHLRSLAMNVVVASSAREDIDPHRCFPKLMTFEDFFELYAAPALKRREKRRAAARATSRTKVSAV